MTADSASRVEWLATLEKLCEEATAGPWRIDDATYGSMEPVLTNIVSADGLGVAQCGGTRNTFQEEEVNARFIAAARTALPKALALARLVEEMVKVLEPAARAANRSHWSGYPDSYEFKDSFDFIPMTLGDLRAARDLHSKLIALRDVKEGEA